jgi:hypothetical protein
MLKSCHNLMVACVSGVTLEILPSKGNRTGMAPKRACTSVQFFPRLCTASFSIIISVQQNETLPLIINLAIRADSTT